MSFALIHPDLIWNEDIHKSFAKARVVKSGEGLPAHYGSINLSQAVGYVAWISFSPPDACQRIAARLRFPLPLEEALLDAAQLRLDLPGLAGQFPSAITKRLDSVSLLSLAALRAGDQSDEIKQVLDNYWKTWRHVQPKTDGNDLQAAGIPTGPAYRRILGALRNAWLDGKINSMEEEAALLDRLVKEA